MRVAVEQQDGTKMDAAARKPSSLASEDCFRSNQTAAYASKFSAAIAGGQKISSQEISPLLGDSAGLLCRKTPLWKRAVDIVTSLGLIVVLSPLLLFIAGTIWLRDGGPVLFKQKRLGLMGRSFVIYKFRTLKQSESATCEHRQFVAKLSTDNAVTTKPDFVDRTIPGGDILRSTSLDELPQLWNILRGDMSLIGPRPDVLEWDDYQRWQLRRFEVVPGVTGLWQVSGKNRLTFNEMIDKDIEYIDKRSFVMDISIALRTCHMLLSRDNY